MNELPLDIIGWVLGAITTGLLGYQKFREKVGREMEQRPTREEMAKSVGTLMTELQEQRDAILKQIDLTEKHLAAQIDALGRRQDGHGDRIRQLEARFEGSLKVLESYHDHIENIRKELTTMWTKINNLDTLSRSRRA